MTQGRGNQAVQVAGMVITSEQYNELRYWTEVRKFTPWQVAHTMGLPVDWVKFLTSISK